MDVPQPALSSERSHFRPRGQMTLRHSGYRPELASFDPVALLVIPLTMLLLSIVIIRAIVAATTV